MRAREWVGLADSELVVEFLAGSPGSASQGDLGLVGEPARLASRLLPAR